MAQKGAVGLVHLCPKQLAGGIVRLFQRDGDDAVIVTGHHFLCRSRRIGEKVECQSVRGVLDSVRQGQVQFEQRVKKPMLGDLKALPQHQIIGIGEIRQSPIVPACRAEALCRIERQQPITGVMARICTIAIVQPRIVHCFPCVVLSGLQRHHGFLIGRVPHAVAAVAAIPVFEIKPLPTMLAPEKLHNRTPVTNFRRPACRCRRYKPVVETRRTEKGCRAQTRFLIMKATSDKAPEMLPPLPAPWSGPKQPRPPSTLRAYLLRCRTDIVARQRAWDRVKRLLPLMLAGLVLSCSSPAPSSGPEAPCPAAVTRARGTRSRPGVPRTARW